MQRKSLIQHESVTGTVPEPTKSPFLLDIYEPMPAEVTLTELAVIGVIPAALSGRYIRNGPNPVRAEPASYHWFTGDGMVHGLAIEDGKALWYRNRWIRSNAVAKARSVSVAPGPRHIFDGVNTNVVAIGGRTLALVEAGSYPVELGETFDEQAYTDFDGALKGSFAAHPHRDPRSGEHHAICYEIENESVIRHVVIDANGRVVREEPITVQHGPMIHDCAITDRFVVILDLPVTFAKEALKPGGGYPYRWNPRHGGRVGLMPRSSGQEEIAWCDVRPGYAFHVANAYDNADGSVTLDLCVYETMFGDDALGPDGRSRGLERWIVDPSTRKVNIHSIDTAPQDFPRPDERFFGRPYRFAWTMAIQSGAAQRSDPGTALYAHDLLMGARQTHDFGVQRHPGEFVFVPESPNSPEGHGWLIGFVVDLADKTTDLVILDARHFAEPPVAQIRLPHRVPAGFHGNWIDRRTP